MYNEKIFDIVDTENKAYWLGFLHADGHLRKRSIEIELKTTDYTHLMMLNEFLANSKRNVEYRSNKNTYRILFNNKYLVERLKELNLKNIKILENIPNELLIHFIRGMFDGDGSIGKDRIDLIGYSDIIHNLHETFFKCGTIENECYKGISRIYIHGLKKGNAKKFLNLLYKNCNTYLERKYLQYSSLI